MNNQPHLILNQLKKIIDFYKFFIKNTKSSNTDLMSAFWFGIDLGDCRLKQRLR